MAKLQYPPDFVATVGPVTAKRLAELPLDPNVELPADVQAAIVRGEMAFESSKRKFYYYKKKQRINNTSPKDKALLPVFVTSVVDKEVQDRRDATLDGLVQQSEGKRGQAPMLNRLRAVRIIVDRLQAEGVPFATGRNSQMNRLVRAWLNERAARSSDLRKSRRNQVTADAVQRLLKEIKGLGD